jgi:hypothetical protein
MPFFRARTAATRKYKSRFIQGDKEDRRFLLQWLGSVPWPAIDFLRNGLKQTKNVEKSISRLTIFSEKNASRTIDKCS